LCVEIKATEIDVTCLTANKKSSAANCLTCKAENKRALKKDAEGKEITPGTCDCITGHVEATPVAAACLSCGENAATCDITAAGI
jgi:hypothetical protein